MIEPTFWVGFNLGILWGGFCVLAGWHIGRVLSR